MALVWEVAGSWSSTAFDAVWRTGNCSSLDIANLATMDEGEATIHRFAHHVTTHLLVVVGEEASRWHKNLFKRDCCFFRGASSDWVQKVVTCYGDHRTIGGGRRHWCWWWWRCHSGRTLWWCFGRRRRRGNWGVPEEAGGAAVGGNLAGGPCLRPNPAAADCVFKGIGKA